MRKNLFSAISLRTASISSLVTAPTISLLMWYITGLGSFEALLLFILLFAIVFAITYFVSAYLHNSRLNKMTRIIKNVSNKQFENYDDIDVENNDELDELIKQTIRASKMVEKELIRLNKIENYRKEFIGDISHELKTPIFAIQGFIETLLNGAIHDGEVNEVFLHKAMKNVNRLTYLTKDLMEISRLETGELKSNMQEMFLRDVVLDVVENLQYKTEDENIELIVHDFDKNIQIRADRNQIKQVLINLIENAIKYNKENGKVEIGMKDLGESKVEMFVKDTGIGIDPNDIERVTERFFRVDKSRSRERGGTGLGLSIVKHIIEAHGEKLTIESKPDEGSVFRFTLTKVSHVSV
ncbi:sensor histidine kinase [Rhodohalobacter sp.]|uniref:sensor histidine kinase n=1 Tax=Rhodohalobacter sp. TaxID=1974210 RepID=UPI002ACEA65F|nr:ATP-binding protein [Rhodohalobacter sp.]MDZ7754908.1 ATP-binding protein [Rhodohalobacter sp.]